MVRTMTARQTYPEGPNRESEEPGNTLGVPGEADGTRVNRWADELGRETLDQIVRAIRSVVYGQVVIMVQDGKVVQIDRTEKVRLR